MIERRLVGWICCALPLLVAPVKGIAQQGTDTPCESGKGYWKMCALEAGEIRDLRDGLGAWVKREVRFVVDGGLGVPDRMLLLREFPDSVVGRNLLLWPSRSERDSFAIERCNRMWTNASAMVCEAKTVRQVDWKALLAQLDHLGLRRIPTQPVAEAPCGRPKPPPPPEPGKLPVDWLPCIRINDGPSMLVEHYEDGLYWQYGFPSFPSPHAKGLRRIQAISDAVYCAMHLQADPPLKRCGKA